MKKPRNLLRKHRQLAKKDWKAGPLERMLHAFKELEEPVQIVIVLGILFLLFWIMSNPYILQGIVKALQLWFAVRGAANYLLAHE